jgi:hypothetical protein
MAMSEANNPSGRIEDRVQTPKHFGASAGFFSLRPRGFSTDAISTDRRSDHTEAILYRMRVPRRHRRNSMTGDFG